MQDKVISLTVSDCIGRITIHRYSHKNALTSEMYLELASLLNECDSNSELKAVLILGNEETFCAGNDLNDFLSTPLNNIQAPPFVFLLALNNFSKPLIAATAGPAIGIGTTMLLHCDHVISADNTLFKMPFVQLGLTPEGASSLLLPQLVGQRKASELLMLGESFDAYQALSFGLVNEICEPSNLVENALTICHRYAAQAPEAVQAAKNLMKAPLKQQIEDVILKEGEVFIERLQSGEAKEALNAFLEKRAPQF
ncbi:enoyl-CoA hydratase-related protein [Psychrobium sp. nBUS_13]|uniref:enoyl-CoA hydratase-related protein n=1 Tax=Psychrobium sp. nBUS_13 TaxID=3395319 RepID=UPI003EBAAF7C